VYSVHLAGGRARLGHPGTRRKASSASPTRSSEAPNDPVRQHRALNRLLVSLDAGRHNLICRRADLHMAFLATPHQEHDRPTPVVYSAPCVSAHRRPRRVPAPWSGIRHEHHIVELVIGHEPRSCAQIPPNRPQIAVIREARRDPREPTFFAQPCGNRPLGRLSLSRLTSRRSAVRSRHRPSHG
jgi:hypothetical protein